MTSFRANKARRQTITGMSRGAMLSIVVIASACASSKPAPAPVVADFAQPLYEELDRNRARFLDGLRLLEEGSMEGADPLLEEATQGLLDGASACDMLPSCEMKRFLRAFDGLLGAQDAILREQAQALASEVGEEAEGDEREPGTAPYMREIPKSESVGSLLRGTELRDLIKLNGPIDAALDDWLTWLRPQLLHAWTNYQFLREEMAPVYEEAGLPEALLFAFVATESGGKVHAHSRAGASGLLQFIRSTGRLYGLREVDGFDQRLDPEMATRANVAYLNDRFKVLDDNLEKALAAYNGGENRLRRLHRSFKGASLWDARFYYSLPRETRDYVPRVMAAAWLFLHADEYGIEWPAIDTSRTTLVIESPIAVDELAVCLGQNGLDEGWFRILRNLNPRLGPGERVEKGEELVFPEVLLPAFESRCQEGVLLEHARRLHDANYPGGSNLAIYVVQPGDTLGKIASRFRCASIRSLAEVNSLRAPSYVIRVGQRLRVPGCN